VKPSTSGRFAPIKSVAVASGLRRASPASPSAAPTSVWQRLSSRSHSRGRALYPLPHSALFEKIAISVAAVAALFLVGGLLVTALHSRIRRRTALALETAADELRLARVATSEGEVPRTASYEGIVEGVPVRISAAWRLVQAIPVAASLPRPLPFRLEVRRHAVGLPRTLTLFEGKFDRDCAIVTDDPEATRDLLSPPRLTRRGSIIHPTLDAGFADWERLGPHDALQCAHEGRAGRDCSGAGGCHAGAGTFDSRKRRTGGALEKRSSAIEPNVFQTSSRSSSPGGSAWSA